MAACDITEVELLLTNLAKLIIIFLLQDPERPRTFPATVLVAGADEYKHFKDNAPNFFTKTF